MHATCDPPDTSYLLATTVHHESLAVHTHTPELLQSGEAAVDHGGLEEQQHEEGEEAVLPVLVQAPQAHTKHLQPH